MARSSNLEGVHVWAQEIVDRTFNSGLFDMPVLLAALSRNGVAEGGFGNSDRSVGAVISGSRDISENDLASTNGSTQRQIMFNSGEVGGGKYLGEDGTTASAGAERSDEKDQSAYVSWCTYDQPIAIKNSTRRKAIGKFERANVFEKATKQSIREANKQLAGDIYTGSPTQTAEDWSAPLGLQQWIRDDNTVGGVNRSSVSGFSSALYETNATNVTLDTLDTANVTYVAKKGGMVDLWIAPVALYLKLKKEARASMQTIVHSNEAPKDGQIGFLKEYFMYNGMMVTFDPFCPASHLFGLTTSSWLFEVAPKENWRIRPFKDLREEGIPGAQDITASGVGIQFRLACNEPYLNIQYTNAS